MYSARLSFGTRLCRTALVLLIGLCCIPPALRADIGDLQSTLKRDYVGKLVILRSAYAGSTLRFSKEGLIQGRVRPGYWSSDTMLQIDDVVTKGGEVRIKAHRVLNIWDPSTGKFSNMLTRVPVEVELEVDPLWSDASSALTLMNKVFTTKGSDLVDIAPEYWKCWLSGDLAQSGGYWRCKSTDSSPTPDGVTPPRVDVTPDPEYNDTARKAGLQGTSVLQLIVDKAGKPVDIRLRRPLGGGLDDKAVEAVRTWRFHPAQKDGKPVAVQINVEINFRLEH